VGHPRSQDGAATAGAAREKVNTRRRRHLNFSGNRKPDLVPIPKWGLAPSLRGACPHFGMGTYSHLNSLP
jgi:hypothetical protein